TYRRMLAEGIGNFTKGGLGDGNVGICKEKDISASASGPKIARSRRTAAAPRFFYAHAHVLRDFGELLGLAIDHNDDFVHGPQRGTNTPKAVLKCCPRSMDRDDNRDGTVTYCFVDKGGRPDAFWSLSRPGFALAFLHR